MILCCLNALLKVQLLAWQKFLCSDTAGGCGLNLPIAWGNSYFCICGRSQQIVTMIPFTLKTIDQRGSLRAASRDTVFVDTKCHTRTTTKPPCELPPWMLLPTSLRSRDPWGSLSGSLRFPEGTRPPPAEVRSHSPNTTGLRGRRIFLISPGSFGGGSMNMASWS